MTTIIDPPTVPHLLGSVVGKAPVRSGCSTWIATSEAESLVTVCRGQ